MLPWSKPRSRREHNTAPMIRADLKAAGIPSDAYDLHSPQHCFASQIVQCGGSVKDSMELARHHHADLTFGRHAHSRLEDLSKIVDRLPDLRFPTPFPHRLSQRGQTRGAPRTIGSPVQNGPRWPHHDIQIGFIAWSRRLLNDDSELITAKD